MKFKVKPLVPGIGDGVHVENNVMIPIEATTTHLTLFPPSLSLSLSHTHTYTQSSSLFLTYMFFLLLFRSMDGNIERKR